MSTAGMKPMGKVMVAVTLRNNEDVIRAADGRLAADQVRTVAANGIVDTGAAMVVLPPDVATKLGLPTTSRMTVRYADHRTASRDVVSQLEVEILGRRATYRAVVEPARTTPLIGAIVLEDLDFLVDPRNHTIVPRDPAGEFQEIE